MANKDTVKFTKFSNSERDAVALDKVSYNANNNTLTLYSSFDNTIKEETVIPTPSIDLDTDLEVRGKPADAKATGDAIRAVRAMIGTPLVATQASDITDITKIYVYTGNESGYLNGHWYYYNGNIWADGGTYNSFAYDTDKTLSIANRPADAQATGDAIDNLNTQLSNIEDEMTDYIDRKAVNGFVYESNILYLASDGEIVGEGVEIVSGGGGGGGGSVVNAKLTVINNTGWLSKTIAQGSDCSVTLQWSSIEDGLETGDGIATVTVNNVTKSTRQITQGIVNFNVSSYLKAGSNKVTIRISDVYDQSRTVTFTITCIALSISSTFDTSTPYDGDIMFPYTPVGAVEKTIYFIVDGVQLGTQTTTISNQQRTYMIPARIHGAHSLRVYFESVINDETVRSNELYYEFMSVTSGNNSPIITSQFSAISVNQFETINIPYRVYTPNAITTDISIYVNGVKQADLTVDRTEQIYVFRANTVGINSIKIKAGDVEKNISFNVIETSIDVTPVTDDLVLYLSADGRSNNEANKNQWSYNNISATLSNFNWVRDGWQQDSDGITVLRLEGDARVTIPYQIFGTDFKGSGKTIEIEFATRQVVNYSSVVLSCFADNIGLKITPQSVLFQGAQTSTSTLYKDNEHIRLAFTVEKQIKDRLMLIYINGIMSRAAQYASGERFSQLNPVGISIGSNDCGIDIYCIRVYDNDLSRQQIVNNWIADTRDGSLMLERYERNNIYDAYGTVQSANLPSDLPYMIFECDEMPQFKGDKKIIGGRYVDPVNSSNSFTFSGCEIDVQGTSSSVYFRKNTDMKFKNCGFDMNNGTHVEDYALRNGSIPFNRFVLKADVASSESANNTKLAMFFNDTNPYKTREMLNDSRVRWGIEGIPIVLFWYNTSTGETTFLG